jgi:hypothetical protein
MLPGCGLVSGLDTLRVDDASPSNDDASDAAADDGPDAATSDAGGLDGAGIACVTQTCAVGMTCCISSGAAGAQCAKDGCSGSLVLHCDDKSDCTTSTQQVCCFANSVAQCGASSGQCVALCNSASQCTGGAQCVPFDAGYGLSLSRCQ